MPDKGNEGRHEVHFIYLDYPFPLRVFSTVTIAAFIDLGTCILMTSYLLGRKKS